LHFGPPKSSAGRRIVGLPRLVVDALAERMAGPGSAEDLVFVVVRDRTVVRRAAKTAHDLLDQCP
jgi:hypothetical protein